MVHASSCLSKRRNLPWKGHLPTQLPCMSVPHMSHILANQSKPSVNWSFSTSLAQGRDLLSYVNGTSETMFFILNGLLRSKDKERRFKLITIFSTLGWALNLTQLFMTHYEIQTSLTSFTLLCHNRLIPDLWTLDILHIALNNSINHCIRV